MVTLFAVASFCNALLLFLVQPMFAKMVLPMLGGSPSVWTTCMLFFQSALLAGYAYAHGVPRLLKIRRHLLLHVVLLGLPLLLLPVRLPETPGPVGQDQPVTWLLLVMLTSVGVPFFVLATGAPLLQRWFSTSGHRAAGDPYFLYAASNAGSLLALILYPIAVEPALSLRLQASVWTGGYVLAAVLTATCAVWAVRLGQARESIRPPAEEQVASPDTAPSLSRRLRWLVLSAVPSSLMLAVTTYLSTDVAPMPLLWILPLAIYIWTFIAAFGFNARTIATVSTRLLPMVLLPLVLLLMVKAGTSLWFMLALHLATFLALSMVCHAELAADRPGARYLTQFYLWLAAGGMLGGLFNTIVAPRVFTSIAEYPLALAMACFARLSAPHIQAILANPRTLVRPAMVGALAVMVLLATSTIPLSPRQTFPLLGLAALVCFSMSREPARFALGVGCLLAVGAVFGQHAWDDVHHAERTFFGVYRVSAYPDKRFLSLFHGTTIHGRQEVDANRPEPLTYYYRNSPIGNLFASRNASQPDSVGVVGLGVGSLAAYAQPGSQWSFYEIDPAVARIATDVRFFRYLNECGSACAIVLGDARLSLETRTTSHDVLVLDAFSSDAIPIHLITVEALRVYLSRLNSGGVLAVHISNRHLDLRPVVARLARDQQLFAIGRNDAVPREAQDRYSSSSWVMMARRPQDLGSLATDAGWTTLTADSKPAWTDDFSNIWTVIKWR